MQIKLNVVTPAVIPAVPMDYISFFYYNDFSERKQKQII
jgi:hypothetical protein